MPASGHLSENFPHFRPRLVSGTVEFPVHHMRGGTSTGLILWERLAPSELVLREELLRHLMGVPLDGRIPGHRQVTGLGRGSATSNKVFFADVEAAPEGLRLVSTLAQLAADHSGIDWSVNCGNMSSALPLWALDAGLIGGDAPTGGHISMEIRNTNTGVVTTARMKRAEEGGFVLEHIPGVDGAFPGVDLFLKDPVGAKTGALLPTGSATDVIQGYEVSCVDVAVPMVIASAADFGKTGHEPGQALEADPEFMTALRRVWVAAGLRMRLRRRDGSLMTEDDLNRSETIPKICIVSAPLDGGHLAVRYFTPQTAHPSMAVSGGCCLAAAALIPGSVAQRLARDIPVPSAQFSDIEVGIENPAGILKATVVGRAQGAAIEIRSAAYLRSAQILLRGHVPLYRASEQLRNSLLACLTSLTPASSPPGSA
ncbi:MAG: PrpF domain-containing protein [Burkholderiaceae bacterium]